MTTWLVTMALQFSSLQVSTWLRHQRFAEDKLSLKVPKFAKFHVKGNCIESFRRAPDCHRRPCQCPNLLTKSPGFNWSCCRCSCCCCCPAAAAPAAAAAAAAAAASVAAAVLAAGASAALLLPCSCCSSYCCRCCCCCSRRSCSSCCHASLLMLVCCLVQVLLPVGPQLSLKACRCVLAHYQWPS